MAKPSANQKEIPKEEREKIQQGAKIKRTKNAEDKLTVKEIERALFEQEKQNLPAILENKMNFIIDRIAEEAVNQGVKGLNSARIHELLGRQTYMSATSNVGYSAKELFIALDAYKRLVSNLNRHILFVPSKANFVAFIGLTVATYNAYLQSPDDEKRNVMNMIDDYIKDMNLDSSKMRRTDAQTTIFEMKSIHGMVEASTPVQVVHSGQVDLGQVMERINQIKKGNVVDAEYKEKD